MILIWIWLLVFDPTMFLILALYLDFVGAKNIIWIMVVSKTSGHIQIKIKMPNPSQEPPASSKAVNEDLRDIDVICNFKTKI